jgi:hypothetical protein
MSKNLHNPRFPPYEGEIRRLYERLGSLVSDYHHDLPNRPAIIRDYEQTMLRMYELGWDDILDWESVLPDEDMPAPYMRRVGPTAWQYGSKNPPPPRTFLQRLRDTVVGRPKL